VNAVIHDSIPDVQSSADSRQLPITRVGIRGVRHPMQVQMRDGATQATIGQWELTVALPAHEKGTHMSRFVALLEEYCPQALTPARFCGMARAMLEKLHARQGAIAVSFPYFLHKVAPVSGVGSLMDYTVTWLARARESAVELQWQVLVPVTSLCPCSKAISQYGAHNQRSHVTVTVVMDAAHPLDLDTLIRTIETQGSCELWGLLKRTDEKYVTEYAYDNPKFVEDLVRDVAGQVSQLEGLKRYCVEAENFESIHNHSAYALIEG